MQQVEQLRAPAALVEALEDLDRLEPLDDYPAALRTAVAEQLAAGTDPLAVTSAVAVAGDALTRRLLRLAEARLGPPPYAYAWLALGSHGRGEQVLSSDQDSALAYGGGRLRDGDAGTYFAALCAAVVDGLARAGVPRCGGGFMATGWRRPLPDYVAEFTRWVERPDPPELVRAEVFLDVRAVHGELDVGVLDGILETGAERAAFMVQMARAAVSFRPPRMVGHHVHTHHGRLDVKHAGTAPIVLLARLYALAAGSRARTTASRLEAARGAGTLSAAGAAELLDAYRLLTAVRLSHQLAQGAAGTEPDDVVTLTALSTAARRRVLDALHTVRVMQEATEIRYATRAVS